MEENKLPKLVDLEEDFWSYTVPVRYPEKKIRCSNNALNAHVRFLMDEVKKHLTVAHDDTVVMAEIRDLTERMGKVEKDLDVTDDPLMEMMNSMNARLASVEERLEEMGAERNKNPWQLIVEKRLDKLEDVTLTGPNFDHRPCPDCGEWPCKCKAPAPPKCASCGKILSTYSEYDDSAKRYCNDACYEDYISKKTEAPRTGGEVEWVLTDPMGAWYELVAYHRKMMGIPIGLPVSEITEIFLRHCTSADIVKPFDNWESNKKRIEAEDRAEAAEKLKADMLKEVHDWLNKWEME